MARAAGFTEIIVPIGGSPVRLVTPKQWRRAVRQGEIERSTKITREHRVTASSEEIAVAEMRADECVELQPLFDEFLGTEPVAEPPVPPPPPPPSEPAPVAVSAPATTAPTATELQQRREKVKSKLSEFEARLGKKASPWADARSIPPKPAAPREPTIKQPARLPASHTTAPAQPTQAPPPAASPQTSNASGSAVLRWLAMYPGALLGSWMVWAFLAWAAGYLSFDLSLLEAVGAYMLGFLGVSLYAQIGMSIAPAKTRFAKWLLIVPYLPFWAFGALLFVLTLYFGVTDDSPGGIVVNEFLSFDQLQPWWQVFWLTFGYIVGGFTIMNEPASTYE